VDSQGQVHALLHYYGEDTDYYRQWHPESGCQMAIALPGNDTYRTPRTVIDQYDIVHLLISQIGSDHYYRSLPATSSGTASLSQVVTIPANVPAPTLAFMLQRPGDVYSDTSGFELLVSAGVTTTAVPITTGGAAWSHAWADMSPWSGQTVTVTFKLTQTSGDPRVQLVLDDVTLGSAYPDSWVRGSGQAVALPGEQVVLQIAYGNQGSIPAENGMLTAVLPDELTFVSASIMPTITNQTLIWDIGDLTAVSIPDTLMITATISSEAPLMQTITLPITLNTETTEIEQLNNTAIIELFIAYRLHLPIIFKP
jgi:uncharacterized repeat protein (TIGR01451 family)